MSGHTLKHITLLVGIGIVFFMLGNNLLSLTNPDEVFYTLTAKEMTQHHTWLTPYIFGQPQFEKPVLFFWLLRVSTSVLGAGSFSARFFPALFALLGCIATYFLCRVSFKDEKKAFLCSVILASSALYIGMGRVVMTDMVF